MSVLTRFFICSALYIGQPVMSYAGLKEAFIAYNNKDYVTAMREFRVLANLGDSWAQYELGMMYYNGAGVPQNFKEAVKWYRLAADQGEAFSQASLGLAYLDGQGVAQDFKEAMRWCRLAANQGHADAQHNLGIMYGNGKGVPTNLVIAYALFNLSASNDARSANKAPANRDKALSILNRYQIEAGQALTRNMNSIGVLNALDAYAATLR